MQSLKIAHRLVAMAVGFFAAMGVLIYMLLSEQSVAIEFSSAELRGVEWHKPARVLFEDLMQHRTYSSAMLAGDASYREQVEAKQAEIDKDFAALVAVDQKLGTEMRTTPLLASLKHDWDKLKAAVPSLSAEESLRRHNQVIYDALRAIIKMGNHSNLILDPDIDSYYLMDATQFKLAYEADQLSQLQAYGMIAAVRGAQGQAPSEGMRNEMVNITSRSHQYLLEGMDNLKYSLDANPELNAALGGLMAVTESSIDSTLDLANKKMLSVEGPPTISAADWMQQTNAAFDNDLKLFDSCLSNLELLLQDRIAGLRWNQAKGLGFVLIVMAAVMGSVGAISASISGPLRKLGEAAERISMGELELAIDTSGKDEVGDLARKFARMQESMVIAARVGGEEL
jgi:methyl-accepting chemotaxis protein